MVSYAACAAAIFTALVAFPTPGRALDLFPTADRSSRSDAPPSAAHNTASSQNSELGDAERTAWPVARRAEPRRAGEGWFPKNSVTDLNIDPTIQPAGEIQHFLVRREEPTPEPLSTPHAAAASPADPANRTAPMPRTAEALVAEYGDPSQDAPVSAAENAPKTMKPIFAALEAGQSDLAFAYVRRHVRYMRKLGERTTEISSLTGAALDAEGMLSQDQAKQWQLLPEHVKMLEEFRAQQKALEAEKAKAIALDDRVKDLFDRAEQGGELAPLEVKKPRAEEQQSRPSEQDLRATTRQELAGALPGSPDGRVEVIFFMRARDRNAQAMAREIEKLHRHRIEDEKVKVVAMTLDTELPEIVKSFRRLTKASFDIKAGSKLASVLGIKDSPTTVFVVPATGKLYREFGVREFGHLDEVVKMMQGK